MPTMATSSLTGPSLLVDGTERERHSLVSLVIDAERHDRELHGHPVMQVLRAVFGEAGPHAQASGRLAVPGAERLEVLAPRPGARRATRPEMPGGPSATWTTPRTA